MRPGEIVVVITSYNDARTVEQAVRSVADQSARAAIARVVLVDDASTDDTIAKARSAWTFTDMPFEVVTTPHNLGPWPNLNRALDHAAQYAAWVCVLHADDWAQPSWVAELTERTRHCPADVASISCSWNSVFADARVEPGEDAPDPFRPIAGDEANVRGTLLRGCWWKLSGAAIRARAFADVGPFDAGFPQCGDWEWLLRALSHGWSFEYLPRALVNYRQHAATMSSSALRNDVEITDGIRLLERYRSVLTRRQRVAFVSERLGFAVRRTGRAVLKRDVRRVFTALRTTLRLTTAAARGLL